MRVAIIHYWLVAMRGGEKVLEALLELFPQADVYTHAFVSEAISPAIRARVAGTTFVGKLPFAARLYKHYLPLMPLALEQLDLRGYDLVISSESGPAKGVLTGADTPHICYCHTPMRYLWDFYQDYLEQAGALTRPLFRLCSHRLRLWDALSAQRVDFFATNSRCVAARVAKHYRREARVIHPPVDVDFFTPADGRFPEPEDCYLYAGQLTAYKRADQAVLACTRLGKRLIVAGAGEDEARLRRLAGPTVSFAGRPDNAALRDIMRRCLALLFPGEEDFGIVPVEVLAAGRPVIAFGRGGVTESVRHGETGILYPEQSVEALCAAIEEFESGRRHFDPAALAAAAGHFSRPRFLREFRAFLDDCLERFTRPD